MATAHVTHQWAANAQQTERPGNSLDNPIDVPRDLTGLSIKIPRIRVVHTTDPLLEGGSMYLQASRSLAWLSCGARTSPGRGTSANATAFTATTGKIEGILLPDERHQDDGPLAHQFLRHLPQFPYRDGGAGATIPKNGATGRNTPHMFGGGLVEMIGLQIRLQAYAIADTNRDGWISKEEAKGKRLIVYNLPEANRAGSPSILAPSMTRLATAIRASTRSSIRSSWTKTAKRIRFRQEPASIPEVAGYQIDSAGASAGATSTCRSARRCSPRSGSFTSSPFDIHSGLQAHDPTNYTSVKCDAHALVSNAGAQQFITAARQGSRRRARPTKTGLPGISLDDPDRDGYCEEISEGDLDVAEWYLLNHPAPTRGKIDADVRAGEKIFAKAGCTSCHVPDWHLLPANPKAKDYTEKFDGDRRFFDLKVAFNIKTDRLEGKIDYLVRQNQNSSEPPA